MSTINTNRYGPKVRVDNSEELEEMVRMESYQTMKVIPLLGVALLISIAVVIIVMYAIF